MTSSTRFPRDAKSSLPLIALCAFAGATLWLVNWSPAGLPNNASRGEHLPDVIVDNFSARKLDRSGNVQYSIKARQLVHFDGHEAADARDVDFLSHSTHRAAVRATAPEAHWSQERDGQDELILSGGVLMRAEAHARMPALELRTPRLVLLPSQMVARSDAGVTVISSNGRFSARKLAYDVEKQQVQMLDVTATLDQAK